MAYKLCYGYLSRVDFRVEFINDIKFGLSVKVNAQGLNLKIRYISMKLDFYSKNGPRNSFLASNLVYQWKWTREGKIPNLIDFDETWFL